jgi:hypothetical protein
VAAFLRGRQDRLQTERLDPELPAPTLRVIEVLVLLLLDLFVRALQGVRR